jgi:hypothetical protein
MNTKKCSCRQLDVSSDNHNTSEIDYISTYKQYADPYERRAQRSHDTICPGSILHNIMNKY